MTVTREKALAPGARHEPSISEGFTKSAWRWHVLRQMGWQSAVRLAVKNVAHVDHFYVLNCNLSALPAVPGKRLGGGEVRQLREDEVSELVDLLPALGPDDRREILIRLRFWADGFKNCYVLRVDGAIVYLQWLVYPSENNLIHEHYRQRFRPLGPKEVMVENAFTMPACRGWGLLPSITVELLKKANGQGFRQAVGYVRKDRIAVLNHFLQIGFKITRLIPEYRVLGRIWRGI